MEDERATINNNDEILNYLLAVKHVQQDNIDFILYGLLLMTADTYSSAKVHKANNNYIWREPNQRADLMANEGHRHETDLLVREM